MDTLKTAVVVVLLLAILYGVYVALNKPEPLSPDLAWPEQGAEPALQIELGTPQISADTHAEHQHSVVEPQLPVPSAAAWQAGSATTPVANPVPTSSSPTTDSSLAPPDLLADDSGPLPTAEPQLPEDAGQFAATETDLNASPRVPQGSRYGESTPLADVATPASPYSQAPRYGDMPIEPATAVEETASAPVPDTDVTDNVNDNAETSESIEETSALTNIGSHTFDDIMQSVQAKLDDEDWYGALLKLSFYYNSPELSPTDHQKLIDWLDPLAGKVVYSAEHLVEPSYQVRPGETLETIAQQHNVPWQLLANINGIRDAGAIPPDSQLKVLRGPFRADVSLSKSELTLFVGKLYAGRFPITLGNNPAPQPGEYRVNDKQPGRTYYAGDGRTLAIDDPVNPYGRVWIDLGGNMSIHGSASTGGTNSAGCISLVPSDAGDVYGILSQGSTVIVRR